jgi:hypothetical protein
MTRFAGLLSVLFSILPKAPVGFQNPIENTFLLLQEALFLNALRLLMF